VITGLRAGGDNYNKLERAEENFSERPSVKAAHGSAHLLIPHRLESSVIGLYLSPYVPASDINKRTEPRDDEEEAKGDADEEEAFRPAADVVSAFPINNEIISSEIRRVMSTIKIDPRWSPDTRAGKTRVDARTHTPTGRVIYR